MAKKSNEFVEISQILQPLCISLLGILSLKQFAHMNSCMKRSCMAISPVGFSVRWIAFRKFCVDTGGIANYSVNNNLKFS